MKKIDWNGAFTKKDYLNCCVISAIIGLIIFGLEMAFIYSSNIKKWFSNITRKFKKETE